MHFQITGRHVEVTAALSAYVGAKVEKLKRYFEGLHSLQVILDKEKNTSNVEVVASLVRGKTVVVRGKDADMYAAIDRACAKAETALTRFKERMKGEKAKQARRIRKQGAAE